jgi:hypothetical protein
MACDPAGTHWRLDCVVTGHASPPSPTPSSAPSGAAVLPTNTVDVMLIHDCAALSE